jgi:hypothetical protein
MESKTMFLDCPAHLDKEGAVRCGLPAEVKCRFIMRSTAGPLESAMITRPDGHCFNAPIEFLSLESTSTTRGRQQLLQQPSGSLRGPQLT